MRSAATSPIGFYGFGSSAHILCQIAACRAQPTRGLSERALLLLGRWNEGACDQSDNRCDCAKRERVC